MFVFGTYATAKRARGCWDFPGNIDTPTRIGNRLLFGTFHIAQVIPRADGESVHKMYIIIIIDLLQPASWEVIERLLYYCTYI